MKRINTIAGFFTVYLLLMVSLIYFASTYEPRQRTENKVENLAGSVSKTFEHELINHQQKQKQKQQEEKPMEKWQPSNSFIIAAISLSSILDLVIILLRANHENKKKAGPEKGKGSSLLESKWFWNLVSLGTIQSKNGRLALSWRNLFIAIAILSFLKYLLARNLSASEEGLKYALLS